MPGGQPPGGGHEGNPKVTAEDGSGRAGSKTSRAEKAATIGDVARAAGVSVATVSRALRALPNVSPTTRASVEEAAAELDYHIDRTASRLATGRTETVGVVVPMFDTWYFGRVLAGVEATLRTGGYDLLVTSVTDTASRHRLASGNAPLHKRVDGIIFVDVLLSEDEIEALERSSLHVVTIGQRTGTFPSVTVDNRAAARGAVRHLVDLGHRRIGCVSGSPATDLEFTVPADRRAGYVDALDAAGLDHEPALEIVTGVSTKDGERAAARLLDVDPAPTAVFAASDDLAYGVLQHARQAEQELSVVGFDDRDLSASMGLSTVRQDPVEHGRLGAELLIDASHRTGSDAPAREVVAGTRLVVRASSVPAAAGAAASPHR
jgi:LacI family transcriptional regulator, repressor for deo operon, udp, cdd, tsx, nupC, and nupG